MNINFLRENNKIGIKPFDEEKLPTQDNKLKKIYKKKNHGHIVIVYM